MDHYGFAILVRLIVIVCSIFIIYFIGLGDGKEKDKDKGRWEEAKKRQKRDTKNLLDHLQGRKTLKITGTF